MEVSDRIVDNTPEVIGNNAVSTKRTYCNLLTNGDIYLGTVLINGKRYKQYVEKSTRFKYIVDVHSHNLSFLRTCKDLYTLGIQNHLFPLKIYDTSILEVDPYSKILRPEEIQKINVECRRNLWYFLRVIARVPVEGGAIGPGAGIPYQLNRGNLALSWCFVNNIDQYVVLPRQIGKTIGALLVILWVFLFSTNTKMMFLCKDGPGSKENLRKLKDLREMLPLYMQSKIVINEDGEKKNAKGDNVTFLLHPINGNRITTVTGGNTIDSADRCGRGLTQAVQLYDEVEFTKYIATIIDAAGPAYNTASRNARSNGAPYGRIFTTTPGNLDSEPVATTREFRAQMMRFSESLYDQDIEVAKNIISTNSAIDIVYVEFSYQQLGKDEKWFIDTCKKVSNNVIKIRREILLKRIRGSSTSPFEPEDLEEISAAMKEPIEEYYINDIYPVYIYEKLNKNIPYIVGVDVASGKVGDYSAVTIIDPYRAKPVADFRSNITNTVKLKDFLVSLIGRLIPRGILVIENNSMGTAVIDMLKLTPVAVNLYFDNNRYIIPDSTVRLDNKGFAELDAKNARAYGVNTNAKTREIMMNILLERVHENKTDFVTKFIIDDLNALVRTPMGRIEAAKGAHDDSIMSYLIAMFILFNGSNLARYGFIRGQKAAEADRPKTRQEFFDELPDDVKEFFAQASNMETGEEYDRRAKEESDEIRRSMNQYSGSNFGGAGRATDYESPEIESLLGEDNDLSWLDDLNE